MTENMMRRTGWLVGLGALVVYGSQISWSALPGEWNAALLSLIGLDPFRPLARPVWQLIMAALAGVSGAHLPAVAALFSAVCGAVAVMLAYHIGVRLRQPPRRSQPLDDPARDRAARWIAGLAAAGFLAACSPLFAVSTRAHPLSLDLALLLGAALLTLIYRDRPSRGVWFGFALLYGLGVSEFATFLLMAPLFGLGWLWLFFRTRTWRWPVVLGGLGLFVLGVGISVAFCAHYAGSPVAAWRGFDGFGLVYKHFLLDQVNQLRYAVPRQGWLIVLLTMVLPALFVFWNGHEQADDPFTNLGLYFLRVILVAVAVVVLFNLPGSPWRVIGSSVLLVTPYAITALWIGQLIGFFYATAAAPSRRSLHRRTVKAWPRRVVAGIAAVVLAAGAVLSALAVSPRRAAPLVELGRDLLAATGERSYLISNGQLDAVIVWQAFAEGRSLRVINPIMAGSPAYMKYLVTWFDDPGLESIAVAGFGPFLDTWMSAGDGVADALAVQDRPDIWGLQGRAWLPDGGVYVARAGTGPLSGEEAAAVERSFALLERHRDAFISDRGWPELWENHQAAAARSLSAYANNLGYFLAGRGLWDEAERAYTAALDYAEDNLHALINLGELAEQAGDEEALTALKERYAAARIRLAGQPSMRELVVRYGYVRNPSLFVREGLAMIQAGLSGRATRHIQQALAFDDQPADTGLALAEALISEGQTGQALTAFEALLAERPDDPAALLGAARSQVLLGDLAGAEARFNRLGELGISTNRLAMERGFLAYRGGSHHEAIAWFEAGLNDPASRGPSAAGLVWSAIALGQPERLSQGLRVLETIPDYFAGQVVLHDIAKAEGNLDRAREHLLNARRLRPGDPETLEKMIRLELIEGRELEARKLLDALLAVDPGHAYGNYLLSSLHEREGRFDLAETALQRALRRGPMPEAYYGLAWIYERQDRLDDALAQIDRALALQPDNPQFIGVKAVVLTRREAWAEAAELFDRADALRAGEMAAWFRLHRAKVYLATGREEEAEALIAALVREGSTLSEAEANLLNTLPQ